MQKTNDLNIKQLCILGLQNLSNKNMSKTNFKFCNTLIFLYLYEYEKKYFNINWINYLFKLLSVHTECYRNIYFFNDIKNGFFNLIMKAYYIKNTL